MADNTTINTANSPGDIISTEDISGTYKIPRTKIVTGAHAVDGGNVTSSNPFPISIWDPASTSGTISVIDAGSTSVVNTLGQTIVTGTATAGSTVSATVSGLASCRVVLTGTTFNGTVQFEKSGDGGVTYVATPVSTPGVTGSTSTAAFTGSASTQVFLINIGGLSQVRVRCTARSAGTLAVSVQTGYGLSELSIIGGVGINTGSNIIGKVGIDTTVPGTTNLVSSRSNSYRGSQISHRSSVTAVDLLNNPSSSAPTVADVTTGGSLSFNTAYRAAFCANSTFGCTVVSGVATQTTANDAAGTHAIKLTIPQITGPNSAVAASYEVFMSVDTAPKWVAKITESQRATGCVVTSLGTVTTAGGTAGTVTVNVVGTGQQTTAQNFIANTAYVLPATGTNIPYVATGFREIRAQVQFSLTDFRTAPTLTLVPALLNDTNSGQYHMGQPLSMPVATGSGAAFFQDFVLEVSGSSGVILLVDTLTGQGASVTIWLQPN